MLEPLREGMTQAKADIDGLLVALATLGEMLQGHQRLLEARHRLPTGRACQRLVARLAAVGDGLVPHLAPQGVVRQPFHLVGEPVGIVLFDGRHNAAMEQALPLVQQPPIGHLVRQGVLEGVLALREQAGFVEELGGLQVRQAAVQRLVGRVGNGLQQRPGHLRANHRGGLEQALLLRWQPVNARRQYCLHRGGDLQALQRPAPGDRHRARPPGLPVSTRVRTLSSRKKGLPWVRAIRSCLSGSRLGSLPSSAWRNSSALAGGSGSSRSCV